MAELFVLEFEGFGEDLYKKVNEGLGIDMNSGQGDWPPGLLVHSAGKTANGWTVVEVWDSRQAQEDFMKERLGAALQQAGVDKPPTKAEWTSLHAHHQPAKAAAGAAS
jgi:uncharacterized protein (DUF927 family)